MSKTTDTGATGAPLDLGKLSLPAAKALHAAVAAIYFDDSSDYRTALYNVVSNLAPSLVEIVENEPRYAWEITDALARRAAPSPQSASVDAIGQPDHIEQALDMVKLKADNECLLDEVKQLRAVIEAAALGVARAALAHPSVSPAPAEIPAILFDGHAVYDEVMANDPSLPRASADQISDVLDAVVRLMRKDRAVLPAPVVAASVKPWRQRVPENPTMAEIRAAAEAEIAELRAAASQAAPAEQHVPSESEQQAVESKLYLDLTQDAFKLGYDGIPAALEALRKAQAAPAGYKLVPLEPTLEMILAGENAYDKQLDVRLDTQPFRDSPDEEFASTCSRVAYRAMLAAAPAIGQAPTAEPVATVEFNAEHLGHLINRLSVANRRDGWAGAAPEYGSERRKQAAEAVEKAERELLDYVKSLATPAEPSRAAIDPKGGA